MTDENSLTRNMTRDFYMKRLLWGFANRRNHVSAQVGWSSYETQLLSFEIATDLEGIDWREVHSILDVGCGYGALAGFLREECGFKGDYYGIDLMPEFISKALTMYNHSKNTFYAGDFFEFNAGIEKYDVVISLGLIGVNFDYPDPTGPKSLHHAERSIERMLALAGKALSFYFPNQDHLDTKAARDDLAYYPIKTIEAFIEDKVSDRCQSYYIEPYSDSQDKRTMAKLFLQG